MMASYRADGGRTRAGALIATALVGGGLLLTASGGVAAETTKSVEKKVRYVLLRTAPAPRDAPTPPPAPDASEPPAAPAAPAAPTPPAPPAPGAAEVTAFRFEHDGGHEDVAAITKGALAEADAAVAAAMAEVKDGEAHRAAMAELRARMPEIRAEIARARAEAARAGAHGQVAMRDCGRKQAMVFRDDHPGQHLTVVRCGDRISAADRAEMRENMIESLEEARSNLARNLDDEWARKARESALAAIDRKLEELRAQK